MALGMTTVFSLKGGVGKTSLAGSICLELKNRGLHVPIITNDPISPLEKVFGSDLALKLPSGKDFPEELDTDSEVIMDLGGFVEDRIIKLLKKSKIVLVPTLNDLLSIQGCLSTVHEVKQFNDQIAIIVNRTDKKEFFDIYELLRDKCPYPVFLIKQSKAMENVFIQKLSISEMMDENPLMKRAYREVNEQLNKVINFIEGKDE